MTVTATRERPAIRVEPEPALRRRLLGDGDAVRPLDRRGRLLSWVGPLAVAAVAGVLRFWDLGRPHQLVFDETYYVKQGYSFLEDGFERSVDPSISTRADQLFTNGTPDVYGTAADFVVHPPVGKWMIAAGEAMFGIESSFGWRFASAVVGTLSVLMLARIARRLLGSDLLGVIAGLLLAVEGHHFVHSRTGLLDVFLMFWALAALGCLLVDRDRARARLADAVTRGGPEALRRFGPGLGLRPWRIAAGVSLGLACGVKWSGLYFLAVFGLMTVLWDLGARRAAGVRRWVVGTGMRDAPAAFVSLVPVAVVTYTASWVGWFRSTDAWDRQWGAQNPSASWGFVPDSVRGLWHYHAEMLNFHKTLTSSHPYEANPWSWLVQGRPTSFFYESPKRGEGGCAVDQCSKAISSVGTPSIWWVAVVAVAVLLVAWAFYRDWRAGAILAGLAGGYLPWFWLQDRTIYAFYAVAFAPYVVLAVTYLLGMVLGPPDAGPRRRTVGTAVVGSYVVATVVLFFWFWPVYTAQVIPYAEWAKRMWLPSWI